MGILCVCVCVCRVCVSWGVIADGARGCRAGTSENASVYGAYAVVVSVCVCVSVRCLCARRLLISGSAQLSIVRRNSERLKCEYF